MILAFAAAVIIIYISARWVMAAGCWNGGCFNVQASCTLGQIQHQDCRNKPHLPEVETYTSISISTLLSLSGPEPVVSCLYRAFYNTLLGYNLLVSIACVLHGEGNALIRITMCSVQILIINKHLFNNEYR